VATGFQFSGVRYDALAQAITRANALYYRSDEWRMIQRNAMKADFSWKQSGKAYAELYQQLTAE
jgi:starch synthase